MKTIITGVTSFRNHGVEALVTTLVEQLRSRLPQPEFLVLDRVPEFDASRVRETDVRFALDLTAKPHFSSRLRAMILKLSNQVEALARDYQSTLREFQTADLVVATGGDVFASEYGHRSLLSHLAPLQVARDLGKPFFFAAHSIGPFKSAADRKAFLDVAKDAAGISVREGKSYDYVTRELGLPQDLVAHTADAAFLLKLPAPERLARLRVYHGFHGSRPVIALTPSQAICNWMNSDYDQHFRTWCAVVDMLLRELDAGIIFVPHVQEISPKNDDRVLATELVRHFNFDPRLQIAGGDYSASEFKGIISQCDMVVSERMHSCIAGLSSAVCTVAIGYSVKAEGILGDLFDPNQIRDGLLLPVKDFLDPAFACEKVRRAWGMRQAVKARLEERLPGVREKAARTFDLIATRMSSGK
ncbi:MAG: polysaccharide pyruvyl transferase family protein [Verrucomicrobiota bacterium]